MMLWVGVREVCGGMTAEGQWQPEGLGHIPEQGGRYLVEGEW